MICTIYKILLFIMLNTSIMSFTQRLNRNKQCLLNIKDNNIYCNTEVKSYIDGSDFLSNKKLITISPGGFKGFYLLGILTYIKEKHDLDNFIYSGASAGSWNSLFMCYKGDPMDFVCKLVDYNIKKTKSITELNTADNTLYCSLSSVEEKASFLDLLLRSKSTLICKNPGFIEPSGLKR